MRTEEVKVYKFNELSEEAKEKAIQKGGEYILDYEWDYEWWDCSFEGFNEELQEVGMTCKTFNFDFDRGRYIEMINPEITDYKKFLTSVLGTKRILAEELIGGFIKNIEISIEKNGEIVIEDNDYDMDNGKPIPTYDELNLELTEYVQNRLDEFLNRLQKEYEYMYSEEYISELLIDNEYEFTENGERW